MIPAFAQLHADDRGLSQRLAATCAELLENALRADGERPAWLKVLLLDDSVEVQVRYEAGSVEAEAFAATLKQVSGRSAIDAFTQSMMRTDEGARTALALARIRYEAQLEVSCKREGGELIITAEGQP